ncbi:MAG: polyphenol oxidase family protein [Patescibacteria group bacterium]
MPYYLPELQDYPITHAFSTKDEGNMSFKWGEEKTVKQNRANFFTELKIDPDFCVTSELIHGDKIVRVTKKDTGYGVLNNDYKIQADGLITNEPGLNLFHLVADCLSILFYDPVNKAIGLAHISRQIDSQPITKKIINEMNKNFKTNPNELIIGIGPSIHQCCYGLKNTELAYLPEWQPFLKQAGDWLIYMNLMGKNLYELTDAGVLQENIFMSEFCTAHSGKFFSHYVDVHTNQSEARFMATIGLNL